MSYTEKTVKMLWGRAASRCSFCRAEVVMDAVGSDDESVVGDMAHIIAREDSGPRGTHHISMTEIEQFQTLIEGRDKYKNLILLCKVHHKLVDDQPHTHRIEKLLDLKNEHERWVRTSLETFDEKSQKEDELYADYIDHWVKVVNLENWRTWTDGILFCGQPALSEDMDTRLRELNLWILTRVWPGRYPKLESAFNMFRYILNEFQITFHKHSQKCGEDQLTTEKFYQRAYDFPPFEVAGLHRMEREFDYHVDLVEDLFLELTRAANRICDCIREEIDPSFWIKRGRLSVMQGMDMTLRTKEFVPQYRPGEEYEGIEIFKESRKTRDRHYA